MNSKRVVTFVSFLALWLAPLAFSAEAPNWEFEFEGSEKVGFEGEKWHEKDYGWLLTGRLTTKSRYTIRPVTYIRFEGFDANDEMVWEGSKTIRRRDLSGSLGGRMEIFVRMLFKDVPANVVALKARFENETGDDEE